LAAKTASIGENAVQNWQKFGEDSNRIVNFGRQYALTASTWVLQQSLLLMEA